MKDRLLFLVLILFVGVSIGQNVTQLLTGHAPREVNIYYETADAFPSWPGIMRAADIMEIAEPTIPGKAQGDFWAMLIETGKSLIGWAVATAGGMGVVIVALGTWALTYLNQKFNSTPWWQKYYPIIACGVIRAEEAVTTTGLDKSGNKGLRRFAEALQYASQAIQKANGNIPLTVEQTASLKEGIEIVRAELEANGTLDVVDDSQDTGVEIHPVGNV